MKNNIILLTVLLLINSSLLAENILIEAKNLECQIITTEKDYFRLDNKYLNKFKIIKSELKIVDEDKFIKSLIL